MLRRSKLAPATLKFGVYVRAGSVQLRNDRYYLNAELPNLISKADAKSVQKNRSTRRNMGHDPKVAERERFELSVELLTLRRFSKPLLSTTQPPLRRLGGSLPKHHNMRWLYFCFSKAAMYWLLGMWSRFQSKWKPLSSTSAISSSRSSRMWVNARSPVPGPMAFSRL